MMAKIITARNEQEFEMKLNDFLKNQIVGLQDIKLTTTNSNDGILYCAMIIFEFLASDYELNLYE